MRLLMSLTAMLIEGIGCFFFLQAYSCDCENDSHRSIIIADCVPVRNVIDCHFRKLDKATADNTKGAGGGEGLLLQFMLSPDVP